MNLTKSECVQICSIIKKEFDRTPGWSWWDHDKQNWSSKPFVRFSLNYYSKLSYKTLLAFRVNGTNFVSRTKRFSNTILELVPETTTSYTCIQLTEIKA